MTLSGALQDDAATLKAGFCYLSGTDESGRAVLLNMASKLGPCTATRESKGRVLWYLIHKALASNEVAQKRGVVFVMNPVGAKLSHFDRRLETILTDSIKGCLPIRLSCIHICRPPKFIAVILPIVKVMMGPVLRKRIRFHTGSSTQVAESLESFGIPKSAFPSDLGGDFRTE
jgi:CRAL/TRIO domain